MAKLATYKTAMIAESIADHSQSLNFGEENLFKIFDECFSFFKIYPGLLSEIPFGIYFS